MRRYFWILLVPAMAWAQLSKPTSNLVDTTGMVKRIDTTWIATKYWVSQTSVDTTALHNQIVLRMLYSDTSAAWFVTRTVLSALGYLPAVDTVSLSTRIDTKLAAADTASLSTRINTKLAATDTASLSARVNLRVLYSDTSSDVATRYWVQSQGYGLTGGDITAVTSGYGLDGGGIADSLHISVDTTEVSTPYDLSLKLAAADTASLSARINLKLAATDTASLSTRIDTKLAAADTASLSTRIDTKLAAADTASLSTRIDTKLAAADTASLSTRINTKLAATDTASLSARINTKLAAADTASLSARINTKLTAADTASLSARIDTKLAATDTASLSTRIDSKQAAGTYLVPNDSTTSRAYSESLYLKKSGGIMSGQLTNTAGIVVTKDDANISLQTPLTGQTATISFKDSLATKWSIFKNSGNDLFFYGTNSALILDYETGNSTTGNILPNTTNTYDIGSTVAQFDTIFGKVFRQNGAAISGDLSTVRDTVVAVLADSTPTVQVGAKQWLRWNAAGDSIFAEWDSCLVGAITIGSGAAGDTAHFSTAEIYPLYWNQTDSIYITNMRCVLQGSSPSLTVDVMWDDTLNGSSGVIHLNSSPPTITSTTVGTADASFDANVIPPLRWIYIKTPTVTTKPTMLHVTLWGYRK